jgi:hypothetical protein
MGSRLINNRSQKLLPRFGVAWSPSSAWPFRTSFGFFCAQESKSSVFDMNRGLGVSDAAKRPLSSLIKAAEVSRQHRNPSREAAKPSKRRFW